MNVGGVCSAGEEASDDVFEVGEAAAGDCGVGGGGEVDSLLRSLTRGLED
jgi:hypothetical protein